MAVDVAIAAAKALFIVLLVLQVMGIGVFFERKVSATRRRLPLVGAAAQVSAPVAPVVASEVAPATEIMWLALGMLYAI